MRMIRSPTANAAWGTSQDVSKGFVERINRVADSSFTGSVDHDQDFGG